MRALHQPVIFALIMLASGELSSAYAQTTTINNATVTVPPGAIPPGDDLFVGTTGTGVLNIVTGGSITTDDTVVGQAAAGNGTVNVTGPGATWTNNSNFTLGDQGTGALNITGGGVVTTTLGSVIGQSAGGSGTISIAGTGSVWNGGGNFLLGESSTGALTISNGGVFNGDSFVLGSLTGSSGAVNLSGATSQFNLTSSLYIADEGNSTFNVTNGATLTVDDLYVSYTNGQGVFNVSGGSTVISDDVVFGYFSDFGKGTANISGAGTTWTIGGDLTVGDEGGAGELNILSGAVVTVAGDLRMGTFDENITRGDILVSGSGSQLTVTGDASIGEERPAIVVVSNGALFQVTGTSYISRDSTGPSMVTVTGVGSQYTTDDLYVGEAGDGTLNVTNGATLQAQDMYVSYGESQAFLNVSGGSTVTSDNVYFGYLSSTGKGTANIDGAGTTWTVGGDMILGYDGGAGELNITGGAVVTAAGNLEMGAFDLDITRGDMLISGTGSQFIVSGNAFLGEERPAIVVVSNGALFQVDGDSHISQALTAPSELTVTGTGSQYITSNLHVGEDGEGALSILDGASVISTAAIVGEGNDGIGAAIVNGGTWNLSLSTLVVGSDGAGTLTVGGGGQLLGASQIRLADNPGSTGVLNIGAAALSAPAAAPGMLDTPQVLFGSGTGNINFNLLGAFSFTPALTGSGDVNVFAGTTTFATNSAGYSGDVAVTGGQAIFNALLPGDVSVSGTGIASGNGTINSLSVLSGGTVAPGNSPGTLNVAGNVSFGPGSTYAVEVDGAQADLISAGGTGTLTGGTVSVSGTPALARYAILTTTGGVTGNFDSLTGSSAFINYSLDYDPSNVYLVVDINSLTIAARSSRQFAVALALDQFPTANPLFAAVIAQDVAGAAQAFDALSGVIYPTLATALVDDNRYVREAITGRLIQAHHGNVGVGGGRYLEPATTASTDASSGHSLVYWSRAFGAWGQYDTANADRDLGGFVTGVDAGLSGGWRAGLATGYLRTDLSTAGRSSAEVDSYVLGAYAGGAIGDGFAFRSGGTWIWNDIDTSRSVAFPGFLEQERANYDGNVGQLFAELAYPIFMREAVLEPFAGLASVHLNMNGFAESGPVAGLTSGGLDMNVGYGTLGVRTGTTVDWDGTTILPHASLAWQHAFGETAPQQTLAFASTGIGMVIQGAPIAQNSALVEIGVDTLVAPDATLGLAYIGQYSEDFSDTGVRGRFNWKF